MKNHLDIPIDSNIIRIMSNNRKEDTHRFAEMFKALSNPNRLKIFLRLVRCCGPGTRFTTNGECSRECVGNLGKDLDIVPSTVSHHIKELHRAGLIQMERRGQNIDCWVSPETLQELAEFFTYSESK